ncbi:MAG: hypothetical protein LBI03_07925 [Clostridiales bacterium]|nr:hypothetical protein [Clostridiales bacterium]
MMPHSGQADIGGLLLAAGVAVGNTILAAAVLSILITESLGAIDVYEPYKNLLERANADA